MQLSAQITLIESTNEIRVKNNEGDKLVKTEPQLMEILLLLAEHKGELVDKQQFIEKIWQGNHLTGEPALTRNIFKLRELLKSLDIHESVVIETVPKKGYRLLVNEKQVPARSYKAKTPLLFAAAILVLIISGLFIFIPSSNNENTISITTTGNDTVIHLNTDKLKVIDLGNTRDSVIILKP